MTQAFNTPVASCPGCGAPIAFEVGSARVRICDHCRSAVARTDRGLEDLGKVADLVPTGARLALGLRGKLQGHAFRLAGRIQMAWEQGVWDEWYAVFDDGRFAWISEAQGRYTVTFRHAKRAIPPFEKLAPGQVIQLERLGRFVVADLEQARYLGAAGELPEVVPLGGAPVPSADLSGGDGAFATIDYSDPDDPQLYAGREVPFEALQLAGGADLGSVGKPRISSAQLACPRCGGPLQLAAPDQAKRVTCPQCGSLLDVNQGKLAYLTTLKKQELPFQLGSKALFFGVTWLLIGWLRRRCRVDAVDYDWDEYLLYDPNSAGFRFLVESDGHWSWVESIGAGDLEQGARGVTWKGRYFKLFSAVQAKVVGVLGEFYWAVEVGETAQVRDYVLPPEGLSYEASRAEVNWSHAVYLQPEEVATAFQEKRPLPHGAGVGMMEPNRFRAQFDSVRPWTWIGAVLATAIFIAAGVGRHQVVFSGQLGATPPASLSKGEPAPAPPAAPAPSDGAAAPGLPGTGATATADPSSAPGAASSTAPAEHAPTPDQPWAGTIGFSEPFQIESRRNLEIELGSSVENGWAFVGGELIRTSDDVVRPFYLETSYYHGVDDGESWSEGSRAASTFMGRVEPGEYVLRGELGWDPSKARPELTFRLTSGVPRFTHLLFVLVILAAFPLVTWLRVSAFEKARWEESNMKED
jgi:Zn finger protein HypA/HybF involved in hydrogenase expression